MALAAYSRFKNKSIPGNCKLFYGLTTSPSAVTLTSGEISTFTSAASTFYEIKADVDGIKFENSGKLNKSGSVFEGKLTVKLTVASQVLANTLIANLYSIIGQGISLIYTDNNKNSFLFGHNANDVLLEKDRDIMSFDYSFDSGETPGEEGKQLITLVFTAKTLSTPIPFNSTIGGTISGGTASFITYAS